MQNAKVKEIASKHSKAAAEVSLSLTPSLQGIYWQQCSMSHGPLMGTG